jgi:hypothetical protein
MHDKSNIVRTIKDLIIIVGIILLFIYQPIVVIILAIGILIGIVIIWLIERDD